MPVCRRGGPGQGCWLASASTPTTPNEVVVLYAVRFGLPSTALTDGSSSQSGVLQPLPVCSVGVNPAVDAFAGLIGPGLYQINLTIPAGTPSKDNSIGCTFKGASTPDGDQIAVGQ